MQVAGFFNVATRLRSRDRPIAALLGAARDDLVTDLPVLLV